MENIKTLIQRMQRLADRLIPYSYPSVKPQDEDDINVLKFASTTVDGYDVVLHFNKHDYGTHYLETFQVLGQDCPFLPFATICKLARAFLGNSNLSLVELFKDNRKIYCWTVVRNKGGVSIPNPYKNNSEICSYEGFAYNYVSPDQVRFY